MFGTEGGTHHDQTEVNRAVARATRESVTTVKRLGFLIADLDIEDGDEEDIGPYVLDRDELDELRFESDSRTFTGGVRLLQADACYP